MRHDLEGKLALVDPWVRAEFGFVDDLMRSLGSACSVESGPGMVFEVGGLAVVRAHPKRRYLCLGFPDALRPEVQALTQAVRPQGGAAWLNYAPGLCDRDTVEALVDASLHFPHGETAGRVVIESRSQPGERADLTLLLTIVRGFKAHEESTAARSGVRVLREAIFLHWEASRLPGHNKYSPLLPHSPEARRRRSAGTRGGLVFEHVRPVSLVIRRLLERVPANEAALRKVLAELSEHVVITKEEDDKLTAAGYRNVMPDPDDTWSRYREGLGLRRSDFKMWTGHR